MKRGILFAGLIALSLIVCNVSASYAKDDKVNLKLQLKQGQTFDLKVSYQILSTANMMGRKNVTTEQAALGLGMEVEGTDDTGFTTIKSTIKSVLYKLHDDSRQVDFDSVNGTSLTTNDAKMLNALIGQSFKIRLSPVGEINDFTGLSDVRERALSVVPGLSNADKRETGNAALRLTATVNLTDTLENAFRLYPKKPVTLNERWSTDPVETIDWPCLKQAIFKISDRRDGITNIKVYHDYKQNDNENHFNSVEANMKMIVSGKVEGKASLDSATGLIKNYRGSGQLAGKLTVIDANGALQLPVTVDITESVERS